MLVYHGTNKEFAAFDAKQARIPNDYYGGGIAYFTDSRDIAIQYAKAMMKKGGGRKIVYNVELNLKNIFDVDHTYDARPFIEKGKTEEFARGAGLLSLGTNKFSVIASLESGSVKLTGEQIFRGLSRGMVNTAKARDKLKQLGYDGLRYNGGINMQTGSHHNVYLVYHPENIRIVNRELMEDKYPMKKFSEYLKEAKLSDPKSGDVVKIGTPGTRLKRFAKITKVTDTQIKTNTHDGYGQPYTFDRSDKLGKGFGPREYGKAPHIELATDKDLDAEERKSMIEGLKKARWEDYSTDKLRTIYSALNWKSFHWKHGYR